MKRSRVPEEQIIAILTEHQARQTCVDLCRRPCSYTWKVGFDGMTVSDAKYPKASQGEQMLNAAEMTEFLSRKWCYRSSSAQSLR